MLLPAIQNAAANLRLKLVKSEAARNPVETLQLEHQRQSQMLEERKAAIETMSGAIRTLADTIKKLASEFPDSPELEQMKQDYADLRSIEQSRMEGGEKPIRPLASSPRRSSALPAFGTWPLPWPRLAACRASPKRSGRRR